MVWDLHAAEAKSESGDLSVSFDHRPPYKIKNIMTALIDIIYNIIYEWYASYEPLSSGKCTDA